jgi:hypothetical protein
MAGEAVDRNQAQEKFASEPGETTEDIFDLWERTYKKE